MNKFALIAGLLGLPAVTTGIADAQPATAQRNTCFFLSQFRQWKAPDDKTIYISVLPDRYYRLDLSGRCPALRWPASHLVTVFRGSDTVCSALDWDLKVSQAPNGIAEPCIVRQMTLLSPAEAAAIPPKFKPARF
jgi:hypothetical protein